MTEEEWLRTTDPEPMLDFLQGKASERKLRLFSVVCVRRIWHLIPEERSRLAVEVTERFVDGLASREDRNAAWASADDLAQEEEYKEECEVNSTSEALVGRLAIFAAVNVAGVSDRHIGDARTTAMFAAEVLEYGGGVAEEERIVQAILLRDIFGNPFHPVSFDSTWLSSTVVALTQATYDNRLLPAGILEPDRIAVLADALEDAGCADADILSHLRGPGPHVRGCFAIDLILGKK